MLIAIIVWLFIGAVGGWLAGVAMKGAGFGLVANIIVGIVGAALAGALPPRQDRPRSSTPQSAPASRSS